MIIQTKVGKVKGIFDNGLYLFKGIPYAKANRFMAPNPIFWDDIFDATNFSKKVPQIEKGNIHLDNISEDALTLNIYTPALDNNLPVLVEIHGGAFQNGSNQSMNPHYVIRNDKFVYVTINYRLGVLGYLYLDEFETSGNNGTLDQLTALEWVKNNIAFFGGNPNQITVLGSSAGAKSIGALMENKRSQDLFNQAILISGAYQSVRTTTTASKVSKRYMDILNIHNQKDLLTLDLNTLLEAQKELCKGNSTCLLGPVSDDVVISKNFYENFHNGNYWKGKILMGCSLNELIFYEWMDKEFEKNYPVICNELFGLKANVAYQEIELLKSQLSINKTLTKVLSDGMYRTYTYKMAQTQSKNGSQVYQYSMNLYPACHVQDHLLALCPQQKYQHLFKTEDSMNKAIDIGNLVRKAYVNFVIYGNPMVDGWNDISIDNSQMIYDQNNEIKLINQTEVCQLFEDEVFA